MFFTIAKSTGSYGFFSFFHRCVNRWNYQASHGTAAAGGSLACLGACGTDAIAEGQLDKASKGYFDLITVLLLSFQSLIEVIQIQKPEMLLHSLPSHLW